MCYRHSVGRHVLVLSLAATVVLWMSGTVRGGVSWSGDVAPVSDGDPPVNPTTWGIGTYAYIGYDGGGSVGISGGSSVTCESGYIGCLATGSGTVNVSGAGSRFTAGSYGLAIGYLGDGTLSVTGGGAAYGYAFVAYGAGSEATVTISGAGSIWDSTVLEVAREGQADLTISDGGALESTECSLAGSPGASAVVRVDGAGSQWNANSIAFGGGHGEIHVVNGGVVATGGLTLMNYGEDGRVSVSGSGSSLQTSYSLYLGHGELQISNGGSATSYDVTLGGPTDLAGVPTAEVATAAIDGAGSVWEISNILDVGRYGNASLTIRNGGQISGTAYCRIGSSVQSLPACVTVTGGGSGLSASSLYLGWGGKGELRVVDGGVVTCESAVVGYVYQVPCIAIVDGPSSAWDVAGDMAMSDNGPGRLCITGGGLVRVGGTLTLNRLGYAESSVDMASGGRLALSDPSGLAGNSLGAFLDLIASDDSIRFWDYDTSAWSDIAAGTAGEDYAVEHIADGELAGFAVLTVLPVGGDANLDGSVGVGDLGVLAANFGMPTGAAWMLGDFSGDGAVGVADLGILAANFGKSMPAQVPEPSTLLTPSLMSLATLRKRRR